jgi:Tol biopolymer transport system component
MHGALAPEPSLFMTNLDGSDNRGLVFGHGSVAPDGLKLVYSDENGILKIMDIRTGDIRVLDIPAGSVADVFWSPDGNKVAFEMFTGANNIYTVDVDGGNFHQLASGNAITVLHGWSGDSRQVLIGSIDSTNQKLLQLVNIQTDQTTPLWPLYFKSNAAISPDNQWIAYTDKVKGRDGGGIYISHLDGSDRHLLIQLEQSGALNPVWSPDGKWLGFNFVDMDAPSVNEFSSGVVNVDTCQAIPLSGVSGELKQWIKP